MRSRIWIVIGVLALAALSYPVLAAVDSSGRQVVVQSYRIDTNACVRTTCTAAGDGAALTVTTGQRYQWTVTSDSAVLVREGSAVGTFASGTGEILNEGAMVEQTASATKVYCASKSGTPLLQLCPIR